MKEYYQMTAQEIEKTLQTNLKDGLTTEQYVRTFQDFGYNEQKAPLKESLFSLFVQQFKDPLIHLLIASGVILFFAGDMFDAYIIVGILLLNATIAAVQENRIASIVNSLQRFKRGDCLVIRDGKKQMMQDRDLVPGDLVVLQEGERIPADGRVVEAYDLKVDESVLTGESAPVVKSADPILSEDTPMMPLEHEGNNMVYAGSYVLSGNAKMVVTATGSYTMSGKVDVEAESFATQMPLEKDIAHLLRFILWLIVFICVSLLIIGIATGKPFAELLAALIALFICVVPQGLPVIMTLVLVSGTYKMAQKHVLVKRLQAAEALGRAEVIVLDKTGTLTRNELMTTHLVVGDSVYTVSGSGYSSKGEIFFNNHKVEKFSDVMRRMLDAALLLDRSQVKYVETTKQYIIKGNPTEAAMRIGAEKAGKTAQMAEQEYEEIFEIPFSAEYQYHAGFYKHDNKGIVFGIGSPEALALHSSAIEPATQKAVEDFLDQGLRVLAVGFKEFNISDVPRDTHEYKRFFSQLFESGLTYLGAFGIQDTLRDRAPQIIQTLKDAGIKIIMATGDNRDTAFHLARQAGICHDEKEILEGVQMQRMSDEQMATRLNDVTIYARVLPADKLRLVTLFQKQGRATVMVGDGVNDAPSLAVAELGVALGNCASEVAKDAADIILLDDSFASMITALRQGRHIFYTFKRVVLYFFTTNFAEVLIMLFALGSGYPVPLVASQILWLNLMTDGFLDTTLSLETSEEDILRSTWLQDHAALITPGLVARIVYMALMVALPSFTIFLWYLPSGLVMARTMTMVAMTCCQWVSALNCRSLASPFFKRNFFQNPLLMITLTGIAVGQIAIIYVPFLQKVFKTVPLEWKHWEVILIIGVTLFVVEELRKTIVYLYSSAR